jgi:hypothetical protein
MEWLASTIEASQLGAFARGSSWAYPAANLIHLLGLVLLVGGIGMVDLRLMGMFPALPLDPLVRALTPLALAGLALMAISGPILFAADATALARSSTFALKLGLIVVALANAVSFRWLRHKELLQNRSLQRLMAGASIALWLWVAALGRMIAYS